VSFTAQREYYLRRSQRQRFPYNLLAIEAIDETKLPRLLKTINASVETAAMHKSATYVGKARRRESAHGVKRQHWPRDGVWCDIAQLGGRFGLSATRDQCNQLNYNVAYVL
jgi:hypothetical protein